MLPAGFEPKKICILFKVVWCFICWLFSNTSRSTRQHRWDTDFFEWGPALLKQIDFYVLFIGSFSITVWYLSWHPALKPVRQGRTLLILVAQRWRHSLCALVQEVTGRSRYLTDTYYMSECLFNKPLKSAVCVCLWVNTVQGCWKQSVDTVIYI